ncbi:haloalkane dehalogenase [Pseudoalteromonas luteoviolacea]|uniref:Putative hydrolase or acyltransferases (Alpha/beta hydrolase superfamily) n=1 Tax=Pseudoalteromonas luteoviolacea (strain 2ta16) TaxID=1353533 RepID=V4HU20_PSEL2|nr:haloalkane dehalogenase [Pseudoalteromonas luteoviolacea]ESP91409.1 putative hydrolase or acyltransferases (alpha/beta hydrolase superfamily) [Pseudoalteromonas luteoviolacea 2ta16]KZN40055.1 hypothetical protein N483_17870 [Pseudoalteromonas luteoviolacea NCIMB 1944]
MHSRNIGTEFPFESKFINVNGHKIHYVEQGKGDPILFIHGNPTSSYIWRNIMPYMSSHGRAIAVDLIGMGRSEQPNIDYGFRDSYDYLQKFITALNLTNITLVVQDWGSGLGFHYANLHRDNIKAIAFMEAMYKPMDYQRLNLGEKLALKVMQSKLGSYFMFGVANSFITQMLPNWTERKLTDEEMREYKAPYPTIQSRKAIQRFPADVPVNGIPEHTARAVQNYHDWLTKTDLPKICFYAEPGMLIRSEDAKWISEHFPNTTMVKLGKGTHFIQEDYPHDIGQRLANWYQQINVT